MTRKVTRFEPPKPPVVEQLPLVHAAPEVERWLRHYWQKLRLPDDQMRYLAVTSDRKEFAEWTGRRLNPMALGCYCYLPLPGEGDGEPRESRDILNHVEGTRTGSLSLGIACESAPGESLQLTLPGFGAAVAVAVAERGARGVVVSDYRHLIFIEPDLLPLGTEVTVAHELIHLADRVGNNPRKHRCHGHDSISVDEAAVTGRDPEMLRELLRDETARREEKLRAMRPHRYLYLCPNCGREYRRVRKYTRAVSCGSCDHAYNPLYLLRLHATLDKSGDIEQVIGPGHAG